ncbi:MULTISPECIES: ArsR/SmtB family transcription factor [Mediterraneibacter]|jgi:DNA-binding transcriptional ArsR family regulator|uniref:ArsR/SmtB family transcription factor n=1 Tax=Mediterraneibacter TaxID=2316020 RepID=UPI000E48A8A9|nr:metalloregulator ArsR/SmtB family transcription factor [Mediterraneibacter massiliensis]RGT71676.1 transcriptional regulator [Ruminococcus sp. AF18-22]
MEQYTLPHQHGQSREQLLKHMPEAEYFQIIADIFKQLSDPTRLRIFWILCHCEECVINISAMMHMSSPAVAHHLRLLRSSGLLESHRDGKETYYRASNSKKAQTLHHMIEQMMEISCIKGEV